MGWNQTKKAQRTNKRYQLRQARHPQPTIDSSRSSYPIEPQIYFYPRSIARTCPIARPGLDHNRPDEAFNPSSNIYPTRRQEPWLCKPQPILGLNHISWPQKSSVGSVVAWHGVAWHGMRWKARSGWAEHTTTEKMRPRPPSLARPHISWDLS